MCTVVSGSLRVLFLQVPYSISSAAQPASHAQTAADSTAGGARREPDRRGWSVQGPWGGCSLDFTFAVLQCFWQRSSKSRLCLTLSTSRPASCMPCKETVRMAAALTCEVARIWEEKTKCPRVGRLRRTCVSVCIRQQGAGCTRAHARVLEKARQSRQTRRSTASFRLRCSPIGSFTFTTSRVVRHLDAGVAPLCRRGHGFAWRMRVF